MTAATTVTVTAGCDRCGRDATWLGTPTAGRGTSYIIDCAHCNDQLTTFAAQLLRTRRTRTGRNRR